MKHFFKHDEFHNCFDNISEFNTPTIIKVDDASTSYGNIIYFDSAINDKRFTKNDYLSFGIIGNGTAQAQFTPPSIFTDQNIISYQINDGVWQPITSSYQISIFVKGGDIIRFKGNLTSYDYRSRSSPFFQISSYDNVRCVVFGNLNSLIYGDNWASTTNTNSAPYMFAAIFKDNKGLISAKYLEIPTCISTATGCFYEMFKGCTLLIDAPEIPLICSDYCCYGMFSGCSALSSIPSDLVIENGDYCCSNMFYNSGLTTVPNISFSLLENDASTLSHAFESAFAKCYSLTDLTSSMYNMPINFDYIYHSMFEECIKLKVGYFPHRSYPYESFIGTHALDSMYKNCTSMLQLSDSYQISAGYINDYGCADMFYGCSSLQFANSYLNVGQIKNNGIARMFYGCTSLSIAPVIDSYDILSGGCSEMFKNCTLLEEASICCRVITLGTVNTPEDFSFYNMFENCDNLINVMCIANSAYDSNSLSATTVFLPDTSGTLYVYGNWDNTNLNEWTVVNIEYNNAFGNEGTLTMPDDFTDQTKLATLYQNIYNQTRYAYSSVYVLCTNTEPIYNVLKQPDVHGSGYVDFSYILYNKNGSMIITKRVDTSTDDTTYSVSFTNVSASQLESIQYQWYTLSNVTFYPFINN